MMTRTRSKAGPAGLVLALVVAASLPAHVARADEGDPGSSPCEIDGDSGSCTDAREGLVQIEDGVIHLDGSTGDASVAREEQSGCSSAGTPSPESTSGWWLPLPFALAFLLASQRRRARR